jgi:chromosomal replication initiator protein
VAGKSTQFAFAAARAVADNLAFAYNPLFLYGASGTGKTHLLHAIGHHLLALRPAAAIVLSSARALAADLAAHLSRGERDAFSAAYGDVDLLLVDDVQFLAAGETTPHAAGQAVFFLLFDELYQRNKQVVLTADVPPKGIAGLDERLRSRFQMGLVADLGLPDAASRVAILRAKADALHLSPPTASLELIASRVHGNVRELEGALTRVAAAADLAHRPLTVDGAAAALAGMAPETPRARMTPVGVVAAVAEHFGVTVEALRARRRDKEIVWPRQVAMYLLREVAGISLSDAGAHLGRDHTTVLHGCERVATRLAQNAELREQIDALARELRGGRFPAGAPTVRAAAAS